VVYWPAGTKMLAEMAKLEMELAGDDAEAKKADALQSWVDLMLEDE
jgi:hypothetical protein